MFVIGLTGGIASGKTAVSRLLRERGATVIDADVVGHEVYRPSLPAWQALIDRFGTDIVGPDQTIDRRKLGAIVFGNPAAMKQLTDIVWPPMKKDMAARLEQCRESGARIVILEAAVLIEAGWQDLVDEVWTTITPPDVAVARVMDRNGLSAEQTRARLASQLSNEERAAHADVVVDNGGSLEALAGRVDALWQEILRRAA